MKKIHFPLALLAAVLTFQACEKTALDTASDSVSRPVVEAYLTPGRVPSVKVVYQIPFESSDTVAKPVEGLTLTIECEGITHPLAYIGEGVYQADSTWEVEPGKTYRLAFDYADGVVSAETTVPDKPLDFEASASSIAIPKIGDPGNGGGFPTFPDPIELTWSALTGVYYLVVVENLETDPTSIFDDTNDDRPRPNFRSEPEQVDQYEIGFQNFRYYGTHRVVVFSLNAEYASLYEDNGNTSQNLTTPYSNVTGGLGIFTAINSDTLEVEVTE